MNERLRVALVSGSNRGIGREIARQLAAEHGHHVVVAARELEAAERTAAELSADGGVALSAAQLEVTDPHSVEALARDLERDPGYLDVLVNNAGVMGKVATNAADASLDEVKDTLETNLFGAWRLTQAVLPLLRRSDHGRIVNVSSGMGQLSDMGGGAPSYRLSKTGLNMLTRVLADEEAGNRVLVNSVCPGWVKTRMGGRSASRSVAQGADTAVWLATLPDHGPTGGFFRDREPIPW